MGGRILVVDDSATIRKVVASILERNDFQPVEARDGFHALEQLEQDPAFELILLDFVMPRMNGYQFCRELRSRAEVKALPVVLMSAKGDKIRGQFVQQTGAVDAITKPFDPRGLIAVVEGALSKQKAGRARPVPEAAAMLEEEVVESQRPSSFSWTRDAGVNRARAAMAFAHRVSEALRPELLRDMDEASYDLAFQRALVPDFLAELAPVLGVTLEGQEDDSLSGDIAVISIAEVLQLLSLQRQTGELRVHTRKGASITLSIHEGDLSLATSAGLRGEFQIGRYLVQDAVVAEAELAGVLSEQGVARTEAAAKAQASLFELTISADGAPVSSAKIPRSPKAEGSTPESGVTASGAAAGDISTLFGQLLLAQGRATEEQIRRALARQASELIYEVVRWSSGRFSFKRGEPSAAAKAADLALQTSAIAMEGFRRVDEWRLIEGSFDFENVLYQDPMAIERLARQGKLTKLEATVLEAIDGERTVREVVAGVRASSFDVCKILYQFVNSRLVRIES